MSFQVLSSSHSMSYFANLLLIVIVSTSHKPSAGGAANAGNVPQISRHHNGYPILPEIDLELFPLRVARELLREFFIVAWGQSCSKNKLCFFFLTGLNIDYSLPIDCDKSSAVIPWTCLKMPDCSSLFSDCQVLSTFTILDPLKMAMNDIHLLYIAIIKSQHDHRPPFKFRANLESSSLYENDDSVSEISELPDPITLPQIIIPDKILNPTTLPLVIPDFSPPIVEASASPHPVDRAQTPAASPSLSHVHQLSCAEGSVQVQGSVEAAAQVKPRKDKTKKPGGQKRKAPKIEATAVPAGKKRKMVGKSVPMVQARGPSARLVLFLLCN